MRTAHKRWVCFVISATVRWRFGRLYLRCGYGPLRMGTRALGTLSREGKHLFLIGGGNFPRKATVTWWEIMLLTNSPVRVTSLLLVRHAKSSRLGMHMTQPKCQFTTCLRLPACGVILNTAVWLSVSVWRKRNVKSEQQSANFCQMTDLRWFLLTTILTFCKQLNVSRRW